MNAKNTVVLGVFLLVTSVNALAAVPTKKSTEPVVYRTPSYTLSSGRIVEGDAVAFAEERGGWPGLRNARGELVRPFLRGDYPTLKSASPLLDVLHHIALYDIEVNFIDGEHFRVSPDFAYNMIFTRDTAYTSLLGANVAFPEEIKKHLRKDRRLRRDLGFITGTGQQIPIPSITRIEKVEDLNNKEFFEKYTTHPYARRTDDVCWVLGYWAAMQVAESDDDARWMLEEFEHFDHNFYHHFFDPADNLYHGQATFIDIGGTGYPEHFGREDAIMVKALSTNSLYARAFEIMAGLCDRLGDRTRAERYRERHRAMVAAIRSNFLHPDGYYSYFKGRDGTLEPRIELVGSAFLVNFGIVTPEEARPVVARVPHNDFGNPLFHPFYPGKRIYHNNAIWPFANTFFNLAEFRANRGPEVLLRTYGNLARHALQGNFNEVIDYETGGQRERHARQYIWSAASYLALVYQFLFGLDLNEAGTATFRPLVPEALGPRMTLSNLVVRGTPLTVSLVGHGGRVAGVSIDGQPAQTASVRLDGQPHTLEIRLEP